MNFRTHPIADCTGSPGWGDKLKAWLSRRGITPTSVRRFKVRWGFSDYCGCEGRREKLNAIGRRVAKWRKRLFRDKQVNPVSIDNRVETVR